MFQKRKIGFWFLVVIGILLNFLFLIGQTGAIINYDFTVSLGLQESKNDITEIGVALNKGFGFGDTFVYIPIFIVGIIGIIRKKLYGLYLLSGAMSITIYWPIVCLSTVFYAKGSPGWNFANYTEYSILLSAISFYGVWGLWYLFNNRNQLING